MSNVFSYSVKHLFFSTAKMADFKAAEKFREDDLTSKSGVMLISWILCRIQKKRGCFIQPLFFGNAAIDFRYTGLFILVRFLFSLVLP